MKSIEVAVLNPEVIPSAEKMMVCAARLTQRGHKIKSLDDFMALYNKSYTEDTVTTMTKLPHPTIQKFGAINVVIVGASRRFLAQITRHQNEVKFMSASLQYSDYSDDAAFAIPYEVMARGEEETYLTSCKLNMANYAEAVKQGLDNDAAGYMAPQGLRNVLIISATPYQWKHITLEQCLKVPKRYTFYLTQKIMDHASAVYDEVTMANSIFPINQHEAQLRRDHLIAANAKLQALDRQLGLLAAVLWKNPENFKGFDNAFTVWGELIIEEAKLISGIRRSDRARYKNLPE